MRLCFYFYQKSKRGDSYLKIHKERRVKSIGKTLFRVLIDCVVQNIFESLFDSVGLMCIFKFMMFMLVVRIGVQVVGCLPIFILILWLLFN